ncbi:UNVERIFIED_CONTAM: putative magnesium transporter NIPA8 [Sesamum calycinum]|uniref:Probable magnesium transporter n=1 Tax=Sesamum calycinum TaxID=2727403 RepID=A0AAW2MM98_9LAMI
MKTGSLNSSGAVGFSPCPFRLLKMNTQDRERHSVVGNDEANGKALMKPIIYFQTWRIGIIFFILGNCLNFISFGYAAQSLLAALGSVQFVSNIAFAYFVLNKTVTVKLIMPSEVSQIKDMKSLVRMVQMKAASLIVKTKAACSLSLGLGEESIHASSVLVMPMVSSKINGFRGNVLDGTKLFSFRPRLE